MNAMSAEIDAMQTDETEMNKAGVDLMHELEKVETVLKEYRYTLVEHPHLGC